MHINECYIVKKGRLVEHMNWKHVNWKHAVRNKVTEDLERFLEACTVLSCLHVTILSILVNKITQKASWIYNTWYIPIVHSFSYTLFFVVLLIVLTDVGLPLEAMVCIRPPVEFGQEIWTKDFQLTLHSLNRCFCFLVPCIIASDCLEVDYHLTWLESCCLYSILLGSKSGGVASVSWLTLLLQAPPPPNAGCQERL